MTSSTEGESGPEETPVAQFDPAHTEITFDTPTDVAEYDLETLEEMGVLTAETEERDGELVVTNATLNLEYLGLMATEFNTTERSLGSRFSRTRYRPDIRLRY